MKLANLSLSVLALAFAASGYGADLTVQGEVISSQGKLNFGKTTTTDPVTGVSETGDAEDNKAITAPGAGLSLQYKLNDALRLGGGVGYTNYAGGKEEIEYSDLSVAANATFDFYKQESFALYGLGGLSYHMVDPKDEKGDLGELTMKSADLLNYDLGLGGRYEVAENVNLSLGYRYSDTLAKGSIDVSAAAINSAVQEKGKIKDVSLQKNEFIASVGYSF
jgi:opacity protein-like surface antigen